MISGFGGQGVMLLGKIISYSGMLEGKYVTWFPSYGPEMRGGTANCTVIVSDDGISTITRFINKAGPIKRNNLEFPLLVILEKGEHCPPFLFTSLVGLVVQFLPQVLS